MLAEFFHIQDNIVNIVPYKLFKRCHQPIRNLTALPTTPIPAAKALVTQMRPEISL
jgi:hypothetical protein